MKARDILVVLASAVAMYAAAVDYVVEGQVENLDGKYMYMYDYDLKMNVDSAMVADGRFRFEGSYDRPAFVRIENGNTFSNCVLDRFAVVDFNTHYPSDGSRLNRRLAGMNAEAEAITGELRRCWVECPERGFSKEETQQIGSSLYEKLRPRLIDLYTEAILENPNGVGESAVMSLGSMGLLTAGEWDALYSCMPEYFKNQNITRRYNKRYTTVRDSQPGRPFIDLKAKTVDGRSASLSDYLGKGKYVLVDFWASWCGPCCEEAEHTLKPLYEKYKDDDRFMILGVASWDEPENTLAALKRYGYEWPQLIDAGVVPGELYGFDGIPYLFLFGPDGTILERDLRGDAIPAKVAEVLGR